MAIKIDFVFTDGTCTTYDYTDNVTNTTLTLLGKAEMWIQSAFKDGYIYIVDTYYPMSAFHSIKASYIPEKE